MQKYVVVGCALKERDQRLLEMLMSLPSTSRFVFRSDKSGAAQSPSLAIVDSALPESLSSFEQLQRSVGNIVPVAIVDTESSPWRHSVQRAALLRRIFNVLNVVVDTELSAAREGGGAIPPSPSHAPISITSKVPAAPAPAATSIHSLQPDAGGINSGEAAFANGGSEIPESLRALVIDDSLAVREQLQAGLFRLGIKCDHATDARHALEALSRCRYDLALLDVVMPGMDGYVLCRKIKEIPEWRNMPVVMLTSRSSPFDRTRGTLAGCDTYLTKPVTWNDFRAAVDKALLKNWNNNRAELAQRGYAGSLP